MKFKNCFKRVSFFLLFFCLLLTSKGIGSDLDSALDKIVKEMVQSVQRYGMTLETTTVALFPFQSDKSLTRKKVNVAVSELLTQKLLKESFFKLVERSQLEILLSEQKLGLTGVVESETAAEVGKMIGARLAALGFIVQVGKSYQISVKLVDTSTSEIIGAVIVEVPVKIFDREASSYLVLVPDRQAIGLYIEGGIFPIIRIDNQPVQSQWGVTVTPTNVQPESPNAIGLGIRYFPFRNWMLDLHFMTLSIKSEFQPYSASFNNENIKPDNLESNLNGAGIRFTLNKSFKIVNHLNGLLGLGAEFIELGHKKRGDEILGDGDVIEGELETENKVAQYFAPLIRLGFEWRIQSRFGLSCFVYGRLSDQKHSIYAAIHHQNETVKMNTQTVHLPQLALGISAVFYF